MRGGLKDLPTTTEQPAIGWWREADKIVRKSGVALAEFNIFFLLMAFCQKWHWFHQILNKKFGRNFSLKK